MRRAREALLGLLTRPWPIPFPGSHTHGSVAVSLLEGLVRLNPTIQDKRQAREALLKWLPGEDTDTAAKLAGNLIQLNPTVEDLRDWRTWAVQPRIDLLVAVRRNSALADWLGALSSLPSLPESIR
jgi:hypothetical protein